MHERLGRALPRPRSTGNVTERRLALSMIASKSSEMRMPRTTDARVRSAKRCRRLTHRRRPGAFLTELWS
jgi:hypothetical protein